MVAKGYSQTAGLDYFETFSPMATIRIVLTLAMSKNWLVKRLDVHSAFLHGELGEDVIMVQPPRCVHSNNPFYVYKFPKALYGLKQTPRAGYTKLSSSLTCWGFKQSQGDSSMFIFHSGANMPIVLIYVDDILLTRTNSQLITNPISTLHSQSTLKDLGDLYFFLGIEAH